MNVGYLILNVIGVVLLTLTNIWYFTHVFVGDWKRNKKKFCYYMDGVNKKDSVIFWIVTVILFASFWFEFMCLAEFISRFNI